MSVILIGNGVPVPTIVVTCFGMVIVRKLLHPAKESSQMDSRLSGRITELSAVINGKKTVVF